MKLLVPRVIKGWAKSREVVPAQTGFVPNGHGREYAMENFDSNWSKVFSEFGLEPTYVEPKFKIFTGHHFLKGAHTHNHKDDAPDGYAHVRCNVMLKKPAFGGNPVIDEEEIDVAVGDLWLVIASLETHASTPISAPHRVIKSFGGLVPLAQLNNLLKVDY
jgi:hypothetical protein